jgi:hypothetical protein
MTTIAFDGTYLAADSQSNRAGCAVEVVTKIFKTKRGWLAGCGNSSSIQMVVNWMNDKGTRPHLEDEDFGGILLKPNGKFCCIYNDLVECYSESPSVMGSGDVIALSAMRAGLSSIEAVKIAATIDNSTGLPVRYVKHDSVAVITVK